MPNFTPEQIHEIENNKQLRETIEDILSRDHKQDRNISNTIQGMLSGNKRAIKQIQSWAKKKHPTKQTTEMN